MSEAIRLLADMNISPLTVALLQQQGWDVIRVSDRLPVNAPDWEVLRLAREEGRILISHDLDFSSLLAISGWPKPSLITLRLYNVDPNTVARHIDRVLRRFGQRLLEGYAVSVDEQSVRLRPLPIS
jgi:predicted nuclease of predicted toxin-antitoxin system